MNRAGIAVVTVAALLAGGVGGYKLAQERPGSAAATAQPPESAAKEERKILYWYDPMYPQQKFDKPGKSPFMDMELVPKYAGEEADAGTVSISPRVVQNLGIRTAGARAGTLEQRLEAVGAVAYNERGVVQLQARAGGFVEKLYARAPLDPVKKGAPLVQILFPDWAAAQEEFLVLRNGGAPELSQAARRRLVLLGMSEGEIAAVERDGKPRPRLTIVSPITGVIAELGIREGMTVSTGTTLFRLVDLATVWVHAEVPELQAGRVRPNVPVEASVAAYPGTVFKGKVDAILPEVNPTTRTLRARIQLDNPQGRLKPGMYATLSFAPARRQEAVLVPSEAVIRTGRRDVVIVALGEGKFRAAPVELGAEAGGQSEIRKGVQPGDQVVLSGQFLIDSEASLSATVSRMESREARPANVHEGVGTVRAADPELGYVELDHEPIPSMKWPAMQMGFYAEDKHAVHGLKEGDRVRFEVYGKPNAEGDFVLKSVVPEKR